MLELKSELKLESECFCESLCHNLFEKALKFIDNPDSKLNLYNYLICLLHLEVVSKHNRNDLFLFNSSIGLLNSD